MPRMLLEQHDFVDFGYTADCHRCRHSLRYGYGKTKMPHSEACRARIEDELKKTADGRRRIALTQERMARHEAVKEPSMPPDAVSKEEEKVMDGQRVAADDWVDVPHGEQAPMTPHSGPALARLPSRGGYGPLILGQHLPGCRNLRVLLTWTPIRSIHPRLLLPQT